MGVGLMADIPDELVPGEREDAVERERQFHRAEVRREVAAVLRDGINDEMAQFGCQLLELADRERLDILGFLYAVEQCIHGNTPHQFSILSLEHVADELAQEIGFRAENGERLDRLVHGLFGEALGLVKRSQRHVRRLLVADVAADRLADELLVARHIEDVVRDLEGKAEALGIRGQGRELVFRGAREDGAAS